MAWFNLRSMWEQTFLRPRLLCRPALWRSILRELRKRGAGERESGGFLLGELRGKTRIVRELVPYDDVDPNSLRGYILFDGSKMDQVWAKCRAQRLTVVADVHTHPGGYGQSSTDQENPMIPERGHIALIVPDYANGLGVPGEIGMYEYLGGRRWVDHSTMGPKFFALRRFTL